MKIGLAQINTIVGDLEGNQRKILHAYQALCQKGAQLVLFPELALIGYPPRDLLFQQNFVTDSQEILNAIAAETTAIPALVGTVVIDKKRDDVESLFSNAAAWCQNGKIQTIGRKCLLPNYGVFDEQRYFQASSEPTIVEYLGQRVGITICEDIWTASPPSPHHCYHYDPVAKLAGQGIDLLLNLSASPWNEGKFSLREAQLQSAVQRCRCPALYCNVVGGNDELIFDGTSLALNEKGERLTRLPSFAESLDIVDTESPQTDLVEGFELRDEAAIEAALTIGLRDYVHKNGFRRAVIGLSGGIDSAVTAAIAVRALGADNVIGISLPSIISSQHSRDDAAALASALGVEYHTLSIAATVAKAEEVLAPLFQGLPRDVTEENIQARARGLLLMAITNKYNDALLLTTGNKSELAVGYCTLYGDMCGGLAVISDLPKMKVYALARWINREQVIIPLSTLEKPPSAELSPEQKDEDSLPPYPILDEILRLYIEERRSSAAIIAAGFDPATVHEVIRKVDRNEYKRKQAAPGLRITPLAFGVGRRIPIVQQYTV